MWWRGTYGGVAVGRLRWEPVLGEIELLFVGQFYCGQWVFVVFERCHDVVHECKDDRVLCLSLAGRTL